MPLFNRKKKPKNSRDRPEAPGYLTLWNAIRGLKARDDMKGSEVIYSAVSRISRTIACMPLHLYRGYQKVTEDARERLVSYAPTPNLTPYQWVMAVTASVLTVGVGYILIVYGDDMVTLERLDPLDPARVQVLRNTDNGELWYQITLDDNRVVTVHNSYMIALQHMSTDGVTGISPVEVLGGTLAYDRKIREVSISQLEGIQESIVLTYPTNLSEEKQLDHVRRFRRAYEESGKHVIILDGGVTADTIKGSLVDAHVLDVDGVTRRKVASVYNLPPRMLGDASSSGYSTSEQDAAEFLTLTLLPLVEQWEQALDRRLLTYEEARSGYSFRFDMDALKRGDTAAMADKHSKGIRGAWITPNEAREEDGLAPLPNGDELMVARDMVPLRIVVEHPELLLGGNAQGGTE